MSFCRKLKIFHHGVYLFQLIANNYIYAINQIGRFIIASCPRFSEISSIENNSTCQSQLLYVKFNSKYDSHKMSSSAYNKSEIKQNKHNSSISPPLSSPLSSLSFGNNSSRRKFKHIQQSLTSPQIFRLKKKPLNEYKSRITSSEVLYPDSPTKEIKESDINQSLNLEINFEGTPTSNNTNNTNNNTAMHPDKHNIARSLFSPLSSSLDSVTDLMTTNYLALDLKNGLGNDDYLLELPSIVFESSKNILHHDKYISKLIDDFKSDSKSTIKLLDHNEMPFTTTLRFRRNSWELYAKKEQAKADLEVYSMFLNRSTNRTTPDFQQSLNVNILTSSLSGRRIIIQHCQKCCPHNKKTRDGSLLPQVTSLRSILKTVPLYSPFSTGLDVHLNHFRNDHY